MKFIESSKLYNAFMHGAEYVMKYRTALNKINVFPVADGDTGTNLQATMKSIISRAKPEKSVKKMMESIADASLGGARGNSGIIFSQYLNGLSMEISGEGSVSMEQFASANLKSVDYAYGAVSDPVEGTMLTVIKDWAQSLFDFHKKAAGFQELLSHGYDKLEKSLLKTKDQLSILRKAGVVDSGAKGFVLFIKGFIDVIVHGVQREMEIPVETENEEEPHIHIETKYRYCVEALIKGCHETEVLRNELLKFGDSLIVAGNSRVARVHIHSDDPESVFDIIGKHEEVLSKKVDDMALQSDIVENRKFNIALITDSIADLPRDFILENQITVVPLNILMNGLEYLDKITISNKRLLDYIDVGDEFPSSSQPDPKTIEANLSFLLDHYDSVIAITVAAALSGTYNSFKTAAGNLNDRGKKISIIDSRQNSGSEGLLVMKCAELIARGMSHERIVEEIDKRIPASKIIVSVSNLITMIKGGRLSESAGK
ncbi:MAG: DegV family protein, partial [Clostridia bacterium]|nr:DegV family protein [Clostridia bacterium]